MKIIISGFLIVLLSLSSLVQAQYIIRGKVTDAQTGEPLPYVVVQLKGTTIGAQTDFDGNYALRTSTMKDSLKATYVGYKVKSRKLANVAEQIVNFQLIENTHELGEVVVKKGENPAWAIIRKVIKNRDNNDMRSLKGYEYDSYTKVQIDVDNISQKMRKKKLMRKVIAAIDSMKKITNDEGKPIIPVFISETISKVYYRGEPYRKKENIAGNKITGIMDESQGSFVSQLTGSTTTEFNFYKNWTRFLGKDFVSPIADSWRDYYEYDLEDSLYIDDEYCYKINVAPKRPADLAFKGTIWITKKDWAIKQTDLTINKSANINFVEKIKIQQEMERTASGPWVPKKVRFLVDMAELADSSAGLLVKFYISNKNIIENQPKDLTFFDVGIEVNEDASFQKDDFWQKNRHDTLSENDKQVFRMVDTIRNLPIVRTYVEIVDLVISGYKKVDWIEFGPYMASYIWNNIEGHRFRLGFRTNMKFHKRLQIKGWSAYGTTDQKVKWGLGFEYWFSKKKWFLIGAEHHYDMEQVSLFSNYRSPGSALFYVFSRLSGKMEFRSPMYISNTNLYAQIDLVKGVTQKVQFTYNQFDRVDYITYPESNFGYYSTPGDTNSPVKNNLKSAELIFETRLAKRETFAYIDHRRISLGTDKFPVITFRFHLGLKGVMGSDFTYQKFSLNLYQKVTIGKFGQSIYSLTGAVVPYTLPYPLLTVHLGNQTVFYNSVAFSMMNFFEFVSDRSVGINYQHHFNGLFFNRIPLFYKLKWREVVSCNALWGTVSKANENLIPNSSIEVADPKGQSHRIPEYRHFRPLDPNIPYVDVGIGIENIFKFVRVEVYRRLTYVHEHNDNLNWGVKIGATLSL